MAGNSSSPIKFDVFISAKSEDFPLAHKIRDFLEKEGIKAFLSDISVAEVGNAQYSETIDSAIEMSRHMVVVASSIENIMSEWVKYEWTLFTTDKRSGKKKGGNIVTLLGSNLSVHDLPGPLRTSEAIPCRQDQYHKLLAFLRPGEPHNIYDEEPYQKGHQKIKMISSAMAGIIAVALVILFSFHHFVGRPSKPSTDPVSTIKTDKEFEKARNSLFGAMPWLKWISYDPSEYDPFSNKMPSEASIREDLEILRRYDFNGLITNTSSGICGKIPQIAHESGFNLVIAGVWDIKNVEERGSALEASSYADAYCLGHRGLENRRYSFEELRSFINDFREKTKKPVTTSEVIGNYESNPRLAEIGDFLFPDAHATWQDTPNPETAWNETVSFARMAAKLRTNSDIPILLKMVSFPSGGSENITIETQLQFFKFAVERAREQADLPGFVYFAYMAAFDPVWKTNEQGFAETEKFTGLFTVDREPKPAVTKIRWKKHQ